MNTIQPTTRTLLGTELGENHSPLLLQLRLKTRGARTRTHTREPDGCHAASIAEDPRLIEYLQRAGGMEM